MGISTAEAVLGEQTRGMEQKEQITDLSRRQALTGEQVARIGERLATAEQKHTTDHEGVRSMGISAAEAVISTQTQLTKIIHGA
ncbi:hypothetical protein D3C81_1367070 [compost metagenome]